MKKIKLLASNQVPKFTTQLPIRFHGHGNIDPDAPRVKVIFKDLKDDSLHEVKARIGSTILETTREFDLNLEGACEASLACSTCHVYIPLDYHDFMEEPNEDEEDMLDLAFGLEDESRLGCQVKIVPEMNGMTITIPRASRNFYHDGHIPEPH